MSIGNNKTQMVVGRMTQLDLEMLKGLPGYKLLLKTLIKSQIQLLVDQLSTHAGEDCLVVTVNVSDGAVSHLGSRLGSDFLEVEHDIKPRFLGHCLKSDFHQKGAQAVGKPDFSKSDDGYWSATNMHTQSHMIQSTSNYVNSQHDVSNLSLDVIECESSDAFITDNTTAPVKTEVYSSTTATTCNSNMEVTVDKENSSESNTYRRCYSQSPGIRTCDSNTKTNNWTTLTQSQLNGDGNKKEITHNQDISRLTPEKGDDNVDDGDLVDDDITVIKVEVDEDEMCMSPDQDGIGHHATSEQESLPSSGFGTRFLNPIYTPADSAQKYEKLLDVYKSSDIPKSTPPVPAETTATTLHSIQRVTNTVTVSRCSDVISGNELTLTSTGHSPGIVVDVDGAPPYKDKALEETLNTMFEGCVRKQKVVPSGSAKVYSCEFCEKLFYRKDYLTQHLRVHTKERPYRCEYCNKGFSQKTPMMSHIKRHHYTMV